MSTILRTAAAAIVASTMAGEASAQMVPQPYPLPPVDMSTPKVPMINNNFSTNNTSINNEGIETIKGPTKGSFSVSQRLSGQTHQKNFANTEACKIYALTFAEQSGSSTNISATCRHIKTNKLVADISCKKESYGELSCKHKFDSKAAEKKITSVGGKFKIYNIDDAYKTGPYETKSIQFKSIEGCKDKIDSLAVEYKARVAGICTDNKSNMIATNRTCVAGRSSTLSAPRSMCFE